CFYPRVEAHEQWQALRNVRWELNLIFSKMERMMQRWLFSLIGIGLIGVIGGSLATRWFTPAASPTQPTPVAATPLPTAAAQLFVPNDQVLDITRLVELNLPTGWKMATVDTATLASKLQTVAADPQPQRREAAQQ